MKMWVRSILLLVLLSLNSGLPASAAIIYDMPLDGSASSSLGSPWSVTAGSLWKSDGSISGYGNHNALLPFNPVAGKVYLLTADVSLDALLTPDDTDWLAMGFVSSLTPPLHQPFFYLPSSAWMFKSALGYGGLFSHELVSVGGFDSVVGSSSSTMSIVLDTRPGTWTAQWFIGSLSVAGPTPLSSNQIRWVGISRYESAVGSFSNFQLSEGVPEPSSLTIAFLGLIGGLLLIVRRRGVRA